MIAAGVNAKALSTFMGHSSIKVTFDLAHGHLMPGTEVRGGGSSRQIPRTGISAQGTDRLSRLRLFSSDARPELAPAERSGNSARSERVLKMLIAENETLFAEHKTGIAKGDGYQIAKAVGSFCQHARRLGAGGSQRREGRSGLGAARWWLCRRRSATVGGRQLDPLPTFAADVLEVGKQLIGVVRVYESTDTPHILLADGSVVVREPAQDSKLRKAGKYEAMPIRSHFELAQLYAAGPPVRGCRCRPARSGPTALSRKFFCDSGGTQAANNDRGVFETVTGEGPALILRAAPLNLSNRWREWSVSEAGAEAMTGLAGSISDRDLETDAPVPHPTGVAVTARERELWKWVSHGHRSFRRVGTAALDGGGGVGLRLGFDVQANSGSRYDWENAGGRWRTPDALSAVG